MHTTTPKTTAGERLAATLEDAAPVCVGLDPVATRLPAAIEGSDPVEAIERFSTGVLDAVAGVVPCVKIQAACFERYGHRGVAAMERVLARAKDAGFVVIFDAKRGDIGISATHYAAGASAIGADWITLNGYLGEDGITPFLDAGLGVFVLVRTSNPRGTRSRHPPAATARSRGSSPAWSTDSARPMEEPARSRSGPWSAPRSRKPRRPFDGACRRRPSCFRDTALKAAGRMGSVRPWTVTEAGCWSRRAARSSMRSSTGRVTGRRP